MASTPDAHRVRGSRHTPGGEPSPLPEGGAATPSGGGIPNTHQLDFYQAMVDFKVMFPNMDEEIIEAVLRANNGAVDATIDQLLTMNVDTAPECAPSHAMVSAKAMEPPGYATVTKSSKWSSQKPVLADSTVSSDDEDPPPYPPYMHAGDDYANADLLGAAAAASSVADEPTYATPKQYIQDPRVPTLTHSLPPPSSRAVAALSSKVGARDDSALLMSDPTSRLIPAPTRTDHTQAMGGITNDLFTPAPNFDPFDDDFFRTPAAPKPAAAVVTAVSPSKERLAAHSPPIHEESPKKSLYSSSGKRWNPPLLGDLPDDFLRISVETVPPPVLAGSSPRSSHHEDRSPRGHKKHKARTSAEQSPSHQPAASSPLNCETIAARMAENSRQRSEVKANTDKAQLLDDEMFALYLQNEEFLNDLREDEDFMRTLEREHMNATAFEPLDEPDVDSSQQKKGSDDTEGYGEDGLGTLGTYPYDKDVAATDENAQLRMQLKHMGGSSKKKLATLARRFFSRTKKKKSSKQMLKDSPLGPSKHNLLEEEETPELGAMSSLREDSESNLERQVDEVDDVPDHKTVQRPPYKPDCVTTYNLPDPDTMC